MFKVIIKSLVKDLEWSAQFESQELAQEWLNQQIGKPHRQPERLVNKLDEEDMPLKDENGDPVQELIPAEFTSEIINISEELELQKKKIEAKQYLSSTDWYVIRFMDSGVEIPQDVKEKRQSAREIL